MIEDGLFEHFPVETVWGMHNFPTVPVGHFITRTGPSWQAPIPCASR